MTPESRELLFTMGSLGLKQLVDSPTRLAFRNGQALSTKIDLIFSNSDNIKATRVLDLNLSDHQVVMVTRKKAVVKKEKVEFKGRSYRNYDREVFQDRVLNSDWGNFFATRDPDTLWEIMESRILDVIEDMCPLKAFKVNKLREPWITNEAIEAIKDKDRLLSRAKRTKDEEDWIRAKRARNVVGRDLELLRADFLKQQQEEHREDPKKFWQSISKIIPNKKKGRGTVWLKDGNTGEEVPPQNVPNFINEFFTNIGPNLAKVHKEPWVYYGTTCQHEIDDITTNREEVIRLCKDINIMKSSGLDQISSRICKDSFTVLVDHLVHIFNCSLSSNIFPSAWKRAKVVPLFKGGAQNEVGNYRPVSLLPLPGKLLEKIVHKGIVQFLGDHDFLSAHQGGFRKGCSTTATIADLTDDIFTQINGGMTTLAAFIDLSKAFDTVNTRILLSKLHRAGIRRNVFDWCKSYLTERSQCTSVNSSTSTYTLLPVSSVLGPLFFLIYINDLQNVFDDCKVKLFADDTVLYQSGENCDQAERKLQLSLNAFSKWCSGNALSINAKKNKIMSFRSRAKVKKCKNANIVLNREKLKLVSSYKYLGFNLDSTLNCGFHISSVIKSVQHKMFMLSKIKRYLTNDVAVQIYKSMLLPYLDYADVIYNRARVADLDKLQRLQSRCLRLCLGQDRFYNTDRAHRDTRVTLLKDRRKSHVLNFMYVRKVRRPDLLNNREIRTRAHDAPLFTTAIPRCEAFKRSVKYMGSELWNNLPPGTRNIATIAAFKESQKRDLQIQLNALA